MTHRIPLAAMVLLGLSLMLLSGCENTARGSDAAAEATKRRFQASQQKWRNVFSVDNSERKPQEPQTRYCYRTQSDVVCYDSAQAGLTSPLMGYQEGQNASWFQPGGGSVGASGGEPTMAAQPLPPAYAAPVDDVTFGDTQPTIDYTAYERNAIIANDISVKR